MTGLQSVPVYKLPLTLSAPRKFSWENAFIDFSMADHDTEAAAAAEAQGVAMAAAAAESVSGIDMPVGRVCSLKGLSKLSVLSQ